MAQKQGPFSGPKYAAQKAKVNYAVSPFVPPILGPEMAPVFGPPFGGRAPSGLMRAGWRRRALGGRRRPWGFSQSVLFQ